MPPNSCNIYTEALVRTHVVPLLAAPVSVSSHALCLADSESLVLLESSIPLALIIFLFHEVP